MGKITALRETKGRDRINLYLDGRFAFSLWAGLVSSERLQCDQVLTEDEIDSLAKSDRYQRCLTAAVNFLGYRPRSMSELRTKLQRRGFDRETQARVIESLKAKGLLDDTAFAAFWTENRESFSPRSRRLTRIELQKKGVPKEAIEQAVASIDDADSAYRAASSHVKSMHWSDRDQFRRRLGGYLQRRGFGYAVVEATLEKIWNDAGAEAKLHTIGINIFDRP
jgi:regulatory protein